MANPFDELSSGHASTTIGGVRSSWRVIFAQLCLVSFVLMWSAPYLETQVHPEQPSESGWMVFFFWTTVVFGVLWFVAGKRQEKQLYEKSLKIDVRDLPRRDPTALGSGLGAALARWGVGLLAFLVVSIIALYPPINALLRNSDLGAGVFIVVIVVLGVAVALFVSHRTPTDINERFEAFASRNALMLDRSKGLPDWANGLFGTLTPPTTKEWSLQGSYVSHPFDITLLRQSAYRKTFAVKSIYVVRIAGVQLATGDDRLRSELAKYDAIIGSTQSDDVCVLYVAGRNQVFSRVNMLRLFAVVDTAVSSTR